MKHTKGKWNLRGNKIFIEDTFKSVATVHVVKNYKDITFEPIEDIEANANATLMSKAPELLEAVINLQKRLEFLINATPSGIERNAMCDENIICLELINSCGGSF